MSDRELAYRVVDTLLELYAHQYGIDKPKFVLEEKHEQA